MDCEITKLYKNTWSISDGHVRMFLLTGVEKALVIDSGISGVDLRDIAGKITHLPLKLLNTHADRDHIAGNDAFEEFYMHPSEAMIYYNLNKGKGKMLPVFDGDVIDLGDRQLEVVHVPGHTPGSITVLDRNERCLIGGDPIQADGEIYMFGLHRDLHSYAAGLARLMKRVDDFDGIYPSHGRLYVGKEVIPQLITGAEAIIAGETVPFEERDMFGNKMIRAYDIGVSRFLCKGERKKC